MLHVLAMFAALENRMLNRLEARDETGGVVIEYGIIVAVIALGLATVGTTLVSAISGWFGEMATKLSGLDV